MSHKIRHISFYKALSPVSRPIADATHRIDEIAFIITRLELESGVIGESNLLSFHYSPAAIAGALFDIAPLVEGIEVNETGQLMQKALAEAEYFGDVGINRWALGAINLAMWDAWGKVLGQPIWKILGTYRQRVPVYGSGGWLSYSMEELIEEVTGYVRRGFKAVKIKVGSADIENDVERLSRVREAVGPSIKVMMDANQGMQLPDALALAKRAQDLSIHWFEEPIVRTDFDGYRTLRQQAGISLAMGEREYDVTALRELVARQALDLWQPDILRLGGVEGWRQSALMANAHGLPVLPHYYKEYDVPLLCTIPNAFACESFDWVDGLVDKPIRVEDGYAYPLPGPGWGFSFKDSTLSPLEATCLKGSVR